MKFIQRAGSGVAAVCLFIMNLFPFIHVHASSPGNLLDSPLALTKLLNYPSGISDVTSINGNRDCQNRKVITRPASKLQSEVSSTECVVDTAYGAVSRSGFLQRPGTTVWGKLQLNNGVSAPVIPVPNSNTAIRFSSGPINTLYLSFTKEFDASLHTTTDLLGQVTHTFDDQQSAFLRDSSGQNLPAVSDSIAFSGNGHWMVVDIRAIGMVRVNLDTFEVLPFSNPANYDIGIDPALQTAITSDGRYAVVASSSFNRFSIYDLATCGPVPAHITQKVNCQSREVSSFVGQQQPGVLTYTNIRFWSNNVLGLLMRYKNADGSTAVSKFSLGVVGADAPNLDYLALGDSHASGEGAYQYKAYSDTATNSCHLSERSYPFLVGLFTSMNRFNSVACSGARITDITSHDPSYFLKDASKVGLMHDDEVFAGFLAGYRPQGMFAERYKPARLTVQVAGNDTGLPAHIRDCLKPGSCFEFYEDRVELYQEINNQFDRLVSLYGQLKSEAGPRATIYALGYAELFSPSGNCALNVHLNAAEMTLGNQLIDYLDSVIALAAKKAGVTYVDVNKAFLGHRLCETTSNDVVVNGLTAGNDIPLLTHGPIGNESYHPNALGQRLLAEAIESQTNNLGEQAIAADPATTLPAMSNDIPLLQAPQPATGRPVSRLSYTPGLVAPLIYRGQTTALNFSHKESLKANADFQVSLLGNHTYNVTTLRSDKAGNLSPSLTLPATIEPGQYRLEISGPNIANEPLKMYASTYVGHGAEDVDGDGIRDTLDGCIGVATSGIDSDQDGIDDSCDGDITNVNNESLHNNLYRVRNGDPSKSERRDFVYVERNTQIARNFLKIDDYDADGDGWALLAQSGGENTGGSFARYWLSQDQTLLATNPGRYKIRVAARSATKGCVLLDPNSFSQVNKGQHRSFKLVQSNAPSCGNPARTSDSTAPLYRLRISQGENHEAAGRVFVERNVAAAEAQLGISDFSRHDDGWAIVGATKGIVRKDIWGMGLIDKDTQKVVARFILPSGSKSVAADKQNDPTLDIQKLEPVVLMKQSNGLCRAISPLRLGLVAKGQQHPMAPVTQLMNQPCV